MICMSLIADAGVVTIYQFQMWVDPAVVRPDGSHWYVLAVYRPGEPYRVIPAFFEWRMDEQAFVEYNRPQSVIPVAAVARWAAVPRAVVSGYQVGEMG
jgi:hypothetical protein